jgi:hypothetical protein
MKHIREEYWFTSSFEVNRTIAELKITDLLQGNINIWKWWTLLLTMIKDREQRIARRASHHTDFLSKLICHHSIHSHVSCMLNERDEDPFCIFRNNQKRDTSRSSFPALEEKNGWLLASDRIIVILTI